MAAGAAALALLLGVMLAFVAVRVRGAADTAVVGACDTVTAIPALIVVVAAQGLIGGASVAVAIVIIALPRAADTARLARAAMRTALGEPYCDAARALGMSETRIVWRHALPQAAPQLAVATAITAATAVLAEAALSFLGFGTPPPDASWGELFRQAHQNDLHWWLAVPAGAMVAIVAAALNRLGQATRTRP
jgi:peptide/nickel transport system permease protein